jgi:hypothetical protein
LSVFGAQPRLRRLMSHTVAVFRTALGLPTCCFSPA